jgi:hypothetical protein
LGLFRGQPSFFPINEFANRLYVIAIGNSGSVFVSFQYRGREVLPTEFGHEAIPNRQVAFSAGGHFENTFRKRGYIAHSFSSIR